MDAQNLNSNYTPWDNHRDGTSPPPRPREKDTQKANDSMKAGRIVIIYIK